MRNRLLPNIALALVAAVTVYGCGDALVEPPEEVPWLSFDRVHITSPNCWCLARARTV
ncbi:MAG: hypothetical protein ACJAYU_002690 [Bradymonadia bacterium]|jgi:hypothetical protein